MFIQSNIRFAGACTMRLALMLAISSAGMWQTTLAQDSEPAPPETAETTTDYGSKSLLSLRQNAEAAEENFYDVFNSVNSEPDFEVHCEYRSTLGSRKKEHQCKPEFLRKYEADLATRNNETFGGSGRRALPPIKTLDKKQEQFQKELAAAIAEYPEMLTALNEFANAKRILETERQRR